MVAASVAFSANAQLFTPESVTGAAFGALAGGIIGHNTGSGHTAEGAGIGAGVGLLLGSMVHQDRVDRGYYSAPAYGYSGSYYYGPRYYSHFHHRGYYGWHRPLIVGSTYVPVPVVAQTQPAPAPAPPQQVTIINNYYNNSTPMSSANAMFGR